MRKLLFILSCLLWLNSYPYVSYPVGTLEKLDGNIATVKLKDVPAPVTMVLSSTSDYYLNTPLVADGRPFVIYNNEALSQVDQGVVYREELSNKDDDSKYKTSIWIMVFSSAIILLVWVLRDYSRLSVKLMITSLICSLSLTVIYFLFRSYAEPERQIISYGKIVELDVYSGRCVIENEYGGQEHYLISSTVFPVCYNEDGKITNPTKEGLIYSNRGILYLYQAFDKDREVLEATIGYINDKNVSGVKNIRIVMITLWLITTILFIFKTLALKKRMNPVIEVQDQRAKIEEERLRQEALKQQEYFQNCEKFVNDFWRDFMDGPEETSVLLARLKLKLEISGYKNWRKDFYVDVEKKAKAYQRPSQEQRQNPSTEKTDFDCFGNLLIDFNGVFVTPEQYQILSQTTKTRNLSRAQVLELCRKLAETRPEFASFKEEQSIQPYVRQEETNEALKLFGLTAENLTIESLKQAYRRLVRKYHPDRNKEANAAEMFQKVQRYHAYLEGLARC